MYDIIVVGAGVAGMSSAIYAKSRGKNVLLIEKESFVGGTIQNISTVTHYAGVLNDESGPELAKRIWKQVKEMDIEIVQGNILDANLSGDTKEIRTDKDCYQAKVVIIATGTIQNELSNINKSKFKYPIALHNSFEQVEQYKDKCVCVVGGSDGAAKEALYLAKKTKKVYMIILEKELSCIEQFKNPIMNSNTIEVITDSSLSEVDNYERLESIKVINNSNKEERIIPLSGGQIFIYIGSHPSTQWCKEIELENGYIKTNTNMETNLPNVYAVGDVRVKKVRQISTAVADGTIAGIQATMKIK
ncbi:thioredoxin reductase (NADPH) [Breznakia sp. PF5-3]|uniref:NAD(P)/FAD-dependent oxidoreductase n=1 Tax=unclassified Breznakia TaxID=2623764 RepID=UPI0024052745|nr:MULTISPECIES: NAD(P)/FAD-dependent oxidoreductase [unclassified Breznakia]MDF9824164.1 thioredoxin reductase (NADPH) [Breznakia sp. PM6-1]MDF9834962.1 thioredoxin reductase (NADPH) [Breznakia sp. PF5-3]MDF9837169.1 thioredoxin reductase (NADPH) [Breznakia sp. PFB2-8]MDF9859159.1 thioredoxin reductase (NADPH) [Breznakia sp. PH5-24]